MKNIQLYIICTLLLLVQLLNANNIPVNAFQKSIIGDWWFLGPLEKTTDAFDIVGKVEKDPLNYFNDDNNNQFKDKIKKISSSLQYGTQHYYQLYEKFNRGDILYALSYVDSKKDQKNAIFQINSGSTNKIECTYISGK